MAFSESNKGTFLKKILIFSILVFSVVFYAYFQVYLKKQDRSEKPVLLENKKVVGFHLTTTTSEVQMKLKDNLWQMIHPHSYPGDHHFMEQNFQIMGRAPVFSVFPFKGDHFGFNPGRAFMEFIYFDGLRKRFIIGKEQGPKNSLYILDKDSERVFLVHSVFGQFLYYPLSMFFHKNLPIPGKNIKSLKRVVFLEKSFEILWEITQTDQPGVLVRWKKAKKKIPREKLSLFLKKLKEFQVDSPLFGEPESFKKTTGLVVETEKTSVTFQFNDKEGELYSKTQNVFARFKPSDLGSLDGELKKMMEETD